MRFPLLLVFTLLGVASVQAAGLKMEVIYSEVANLTYQLDVVAGENPSADPSNFQQLWKQEFLKTDADQAMVDQWKRVCDRYHASVQLPGLAMPLETEWSSIDLSERVRILGLGAPTLEAYGEGLSLLVLPKDGLLFQQVLDHFRPAFHAWWVREAEPKGQRFVTEIRSELSKPALLEQVERFRHFYGSTLPDGYVARFSMVYRPELVKARTSGQQMAGMAVVEFLPGEDPKSRLDVVLHEFCHFLYGTRASEANLKLQNAFLKSGDFGAKPAFNLLNEAMATVLGNGIVGRQMHDPATWEAYLKRPRSFYNNDAIDRGAKSMLAVMDKWLPEGKTLDDPDFVSTYLGALKKEFGEELTKPSMFLTETFIFVDSQIGIDFSRGLRRSLRVASAYTSVADAPTVDNIAEFLEHPNLSAIFVVTPKQVEALRNSKIVDEEGLAAIRAGIARDKSVLFGTARNPIAPTFVIVADTKEEADKRLQALAAAPKLFRGVYAP